MTDKIGVLGEATTTTVGTTTVYTVPASKAAKVRIMWAGEAHASTSTGDLTITVNGIVVAERLNFPAGEEFWSNSTTPVHQHRKSTTYLLVIQLRIPLQRLLW